MSDQLKRFLAGIISRAENGAAAANGVSTKEREDGSVEVNFAVPVEMRWPAAGELDLAEPDGGERADDADAREIEMSFSSEAPVMRYGVAEILSHEKADADFRRLKQVGAILKNHDPNRIIGRPLKVWLDKESRKGRVRFRFGTTAEAKKARHEVLVDKDLRGSSVGYAVRQYVYLKDEDVEYKGRIKGPAYVATKWEALEASLTPIAADPTVGVGRSYGQGVGTHTAKETTNMDPKFKAWLVAKGLKPEDIREDAIERLRSEFDQETRDAAANVPEAEPAEDKTVRDVTPPAGDTGSPDLDKARAEARKAEQSRVGGIIQLCARHHIDDARRDEMINSNVTMADAQARVLSILENEHGAMAGRTEVIVDGRTSFARAAVEALDLRRGQMSRRDVKHGGDVLAVLSLREMARECLKRANISAPGDLHSMIRLAMRGPAIMQADIDALLRGGDIISGTTSDFPYILAATANKSMLAGYGAVRTSYEKWCRIGSLSDFKATNRVKISEAGDLQKILEAGHYPETSFSEDQNPIQVYTYGLKFNISRQAIINDDMSVFTSIPQRLGRSARRLPNILAVIELCANRTMNDALALFSSGHNNLSDDADYALDTLAHGLNGIKNTRKLLGEQRGMLHAKASAESKTLYMGLELKYLLVATDDQEFIARQIIGSPTNPSQSNPAVINPLQGSAEVVTERMLADSGITGYSTSAYYGFADPADAPVIEVAFLNGVREPYMEEVDQTDADGRVYKVRLDCGAAEIDYAGAVKEAGAS